MAEIVKELTKENLSIAMIATDPKAALLNLAEDHPDSMIVLFSMYEDRPYAAEVLEKSARNASKEHPVTTLYYSDRYKDQPYAAEVIEKAARNLAENDPSIALAYSDKYKDQPYAAEVIEKAVRALGPKSALFSFVDYKDQPYAAELLEKAARNLAENDPREALLYSDNYKDQPYATELIEKAARFLAENDPSEALADSDKYKDQPYATEVIEKAVRALPDNDLERLLEYAPLYKGQPYAAELLEKAARNTAESDSIIALKYADIYKDNPHKAELIERAVRNTAESNSTIALKYADSYKDQPYAAEIIEYAINGQKDNVGSNLLVRRFNNLHDEADVVRFELTEGLAAATLYKIIAGGRQELYTSTYNGLLDRFNDQLEAEGKTLLDIVEGDDKTTAQLPIFIEAAAAYNRLNDVMQNIPTDRQEFITQTMINQARTSDDFNYTVALADTVIALDSEELSASLSKQIRKAYEEERNPDAKIKLGLVASTWATENIDIIPQEDRAFYMGIRENPDFKLLPMDSIKSEDLQDEKGDHYQLYTFYDDPDGKASHNHFISSYKRDSKNWEVEDKGDYVYIHSKNGDVNVHIYANKPEEEGVGVKAAHAAVQERQGGDEPIFNLVAHRGHSYHANSSISHIDDNAQMVFLGSCGSYHNISSVLQLSPDAHIISTQGTGTMLVNDPLFLAINNRIREGKDVDWSDIWDEDMAKISDHRKEDYIRPDQNRATLLNAKYNELSNKDSSSHAVELDPIPENQARLSANQAEQTISR